MTWGFRRSFGTKGFRLTLAKKGSGYGWGIPCFHRGISPDGRRYVAVWVVGNRTLLDQVFRTAPRALVPLLALGQRLESVTPVTLILTLAELTDRRHCQTMQ
jgi:hypothetical protein